MWGREAANAAVHLFRKALIIASELIRPISRVPSQLTQPARRAALLLFLAGVLGLLGGRQGDTANRITSPPVWGQVGCGVSRLCSATGFDAAFCLSLVGVGGLAALIAQGLGYVVGFFRNNSSRSTH